MIDNKPNSKPLTDPFPFLFVKLLLCSLTFFMGNDDGLCFHILKNPAPFLVKITSS